MRRTGTRFIIIFFLLNILVGLLGGEVYAYGKVADQNNGDWNSGRFSLINTSEAQIMIRVGDIDNFGYPFVDRYGEPLDPFTGRETKVHGFPFVPEGDDPAGTDRIMVVSGYRYSRRNKDGYTSRTRRYDWSGGVSNVVRSIRLSYPKEIRGVSVEDAYLQMFLDDFQAKKEGVTVGFRGNNVYKTKISGIVDGIFREEWLPELDNIINNLNQHGPKGNMITFQIPERCLYLVQSGEFNIEIDDKRNGATGDGYAIDFVKLLINKKGFRYTASIRGKVYDIDGNPIEGAKVEGGGVQVRTDSQGEYILNEVPAGQIIIYASKMGYEGQNHRIETVKGGNSFLVDFYMPLKPKPSNPVISYYPMEDTHEDVVINIDYPEEPTFPDIKEYRIDNGNWCTYNGAFTIKENCMIFARATSNDGNQSDEIFREIDNLLRTDIGISVIDANGEIDRYFAGGKEREISRILENPLETKGDVYALISLQGRELSDFKYQFIDSEEIPKNIYDQWEVIGIEGSSNEFKLNYPEEGGNYYFAYEGLADNTLIRKGIYGPFQVQERTSIFVEKHLKKGNVAQVGEHVEIEYSISPERMKANSLFKEDGVYKEEITLLGVKVKEKFPEGINVIEIIGGETSNVVQEEITVELGNIIYRLNDEGEYPLYEGEKKKLTIIAQGEEKGKYLLSEAGESRFEFLDFNGENRTVQFPQNNLSVVERSKGITHIRREIPVKAVADSEIPLRYEFHGEEIFLYGYGGSVELDTLEYEEVFPPRVEILEMPQGFQKEGSFDMGYTLRGTPEGVSFIKKSNGKYLIDGEFNIKIRVPYPVQCVFKNGSLRYGLGNPVEGTALSNGGTMEVQGKLLNSLEVLEVQPEREFVLNDGQFDGLMVAGRKANITQMSVDEFIGNIESINGKYDLIYIGEGIGGYTHKGEQAVKIPGMNGVQEETREFYSERDITDKKGRELREYIESGQLIFIEEGVLAESKTKMYKNIFEFKDHENVHIVAGGEEITEGLKELYDSSSKRPLIHIKSAPKNYDGTVESYEENSVINIVYDLENQNFKDGNENVMDVKLFIDVDGDGIFKEEEIQKQGEPKKNGRGYSISCEVKDYFTGMMPWKLLIQDRITGSKNYKVGYPAFKGEKLKVRVLHLLPTNGSVLKLDNERGFIPSLDNSEYKIEVKELKINEFDNNYPNDVISGGETIKTRLNGNYDMVIFGFKDVYGNSDLKSSEAIGEIKDFIRTEQSVMFTHDTFMFYVNDQNSACFNLTKEFRDLAGQSRYTDKNNPEELDVSGERIIHSDYPDEGKYSYGFSEGALDRAAKGNFPRVNSAMKVNKSVITSYPYVLGDTIPVATTHYQYFQLNLEDEDVVPLYNLKFSDSRKYDSRNYYYTYSRGNITYSGSGHSAPNGEEEQKLFVNTIMKSSRNANKAPSLEILNLEQGKLIAKTAEKMDFDFVVRDLDGDEIKVEVSVNGTLVERFDYGRIKLGESTKVSIGGGALRDIISEEDSFEIKVQCWDSKGATSQEERILDYKIVPVLNLASEDSHGYLVGDKASMKMDINAVKPQEGVITRIENISYTMEYDENEIEFLRGTSWNNISHVDFDPEPNPKQQWKVFSFETKKVGTFTIKGNLDYDYSNINNVDSRRSYTHLVDVREGRVAIKVIDGNGSGFEEGEVEITYPSGKKERIRTDSNGRILLGDLSSGRYYFEIVDLQERYYVKDGVEKTLDLSYEDNSKEIVFNVIDTDKTSMIIQGEVEEGYLINDSVDITLEAVAINTNGNINTVIHGFQHSLVYDKNRMKIENEDVNWNLKKVTIDGENIQNRVQRKVYSLRFKEEGNGAFMNTIEYEYFDGISGIASSVKEFNVREGAIKVGVVSSGDSVCSDIEVLVRSMDSGNIIARGNTDETGKIEFRRLPTGSYKIYVPDLYDFTSEGGSSEEVYLGYYEPQKEIYFKSEKDITIIDSGIFMRKGFVDSKDIVTGFDTDFGVDFKTLEKEVNLNIIMDPKIDAVRFKVFKWEKYGKISELEGDIEVFISGEKIQRDSKGYFDLSSYAGEKIELEIPETDELYKHYILKCSIKQNALPGISINLRVNLNSSEEREEKFNIVDIPKLD